MERKTNCNRGTALERSVENKKKKQKKNNKKNKQKKQKKKKKTRKKQQQQTKKKQTKKKKTKKKKTKKNWCMWDGLVLKPALLSDQLRALLLKTHPVKRGYSGMIEIYMRAPGEA